MKAVFLDRDGTLIVETPAERVTAVRELELFGDTIEALKLLDAHGFSLIIISNQAGIGEKLIAMETYQIINSALLEMLKPSGARIVKAYVCPHTAKDNCECRKPKPKMILDAAKEFDINLTESFMIGDRDSDIGAGKNAGTKTILVKTGTAVATGKDADYTAEKLLDAVEFVVKNS